MKLRLLSYIALTILLAACGAKGSPGAETGSGQALEASSASSARLSAESRPFSSAEAPVPAENALELMYEDAKAVQELTNSVWPDLSSQEQQILAPVLQIFSQDVEILGYYLEVSQHEPLTEDDLEILLPVMVDIEDAMELIAQAIEQLL